MDNKDQKIINPVTGEIADEELDQVTGGSDSSDTCDDTCASEVVIEDDITAETVQVQFPVTVSVAKGTSVIDFDINLAEMGLSVSEDLWAVLLERYIDSGSTFNCYVRIQFTDAVSGQVVVAK